MVKVHRYVHQQLWHVEEWSQQGRYQYHADLQAEATGPLGIDIEWQEWKSTWIGAEFLDTPPPSEREKFVDILIRRPLPIRTHQRKSTA